MAVLTASFLLNHSYNYQLTESTHHYAEDPHSLFSLTGFPQQAMLNLIF